MGFFLVLFFNRDIPNLCRGCLGFGPESSRHSVCYWGSCSCTLGNLSLPGTFSSLGELWTPSQASTPFQAGGEQLAAVFQPSLTTSLHPHCHSKEQRDPAIVLVTPSLALQSLCLAGLTSRLPTNMQDQLLILSLGKFRISAKNSPHINSLLQDPGSRICSTAHCGFAINIYLTGNSVFQAKAPDISTDYISIWGSVEVSLFLKGHTSPQKKLLAPSWPGSIPPPMGPTALQASLAAPHHARHPPSSHAPLSHLTLSTELSGYCAMQAISVQVQGRHFHSH